MSNDKLPWEITDVPKEEIDELQKHRTGIHLEFIRVGPQGYFHPAGLKEDAEILYGMELRPSDVFVASFPKSGTTWTQELVWLIGNDHDYEAASRTLLTERFPFIELMMLFKEPRAKEWIMNNSVGDKGELEKMLSLDSIAKVLCDMPSPRFIKTHLPFSMLPSAILDTAKVIYVARDPRDVAVSYYHHCRLYKTIGFSSDFKTFWNLFINGQLEWSPFFPHVKEAWELRNHPNMLFLFYEELSKDLPAIIRRVAEFLDKPITEDQVLRLCDHLHIDNFRNNKSVNFEELRAFGMVSSDENFIRKGKTGGWRAYFDEEMTQQAERWMQENLRDTDLQFPLNKN